MKNKVSYVNESSYVVMLPEMGEIIFKDIDGKITKRVKRGKKDDDKVRVIAFFFGKRGPSTVEIKYRNWKG